MRPNLALNRPVSRAWIAAVLVALLCGAPGSGRADTIDQRSDVDDPTFMAYDNIETGYAGGQTFRPALDAIDFIYVAMLCMNTEPGDSVTYVVDLHHGDLATPAIAVSMPVRLFAADPRVLRFDFATTVPLVPEDTYTFALRRTAGSDQNGLATGYQTYPRGYLLTILYGDTQDFDAWFKEGILSETPARASTWGRLKADYR